MEIQDFKRWHWAVIGVLVGLVMSFAFSDHDVATDSGWRDKEIKQPVFEREAFSRSHASHEPLLQNVMVEPPVLDYLNHSKQIVRGDRLRYSDKYKQEFRDSFFFYADVPYVPLIKPSNLDPSAIANVKTVMDFLSLARNTISPTTAPATPAPWQAGIPFHYRFAWEYESNWNMVLWALGGVAIIGGVWPTFLNLLVGAGFGKAPKPKLDEADAYLNRFGGGKPEPSRPATPTIDVDRENRRLDDLNAALESSLMPSGVAKIASAASDDSNVAPAIRNLDVDGITPATAPVAEPNNESEEERRKRYAAGDFYPVARGPTKKS